MNYHDLKKGTNRIIHECCKNGAARHAVVRVNGKIEYFDELHMRAMQIFVMQMSDEEYKDFCNSVVIYNGRTVKSSTGTITIKRDGRLSDSFVSGFYCATGDLARYMLLHTPRLVVE